MPVNEKYRDLYRNISEFLTFGIWSTSIDDLPKRKSRLFNLARVLVLAARGVMRNRIQLRASALTFYSLMSLVPVLGLVFAIAKGFGLEHNLDRLIREKLFAYPSLADKLVEFSMSLLERTGSGLIAGVGVVMLFWSVLKVFINIEKSFNAIWQIRQPRSWLRKISDYTSMMLIAPILILIASSASVFLRTSLSQASSNVEMVGMLKPYAMVLLQVVPSLLVCLVFGLLYLVMPNTKVHVKSAMISGLVAGIIFSVVQWAYLYFQFGMSNYNAIYGSFAAIPLFLVWTQLSWVIVLLGAELSYAMQNTHLYEFEREIVYLSPKRRKELSLLLLSTILQRFRQGDPPLTSEELSSLHALPLRLSRTLLQQMEECGLLVRIVNRNDRDQVFHPSRPEDFYTVGNVLSRLESHGESIQARGEALESIERLSQRGIEGVERDSTPLYTLGLKPLSPEARNDNRKQKGSIDRYLVL